MSAPLQLAQNLSNNIMIPEPPATVLNSTPPSASDNDDPLLAPGGSVPTNANAGAPAGQTAGTQPLGDINQAAQGNFHAHTGTFDSQPANFGLNAATGQTPMHLMHPFMTMPYLLAAQFQNPAGMLLPSQTQFQALPQGTEATTHATQQQQMPPYVGAANAPIPVRPLTPPAIAPPVPSARSRLLPRHAHQDIVRNREDYPRVPFWTLADLRNADNVAAPVPGLAKVRGATLVSKGINKTMLWLTDADGNPVSGHKCTAVRKRAREYFLLLANEKRHPPSWQGGADSSMKDDLNELLRASFVEMQYCDDTNWKSQVLATAIYPQWFKKYEARMAKLAAEAQLKAQGTIIEAQPKPKKTKKTKKTKKGKKKAAAKEAESDSSSEDDIERVAMSSELEYISLDDAKYTVGANPEDADAGQAKRRRVHASASPAEVVTTPPSSDSPSPTFLSPRDSPTPAVDDNELCPTPATVDDTSPAKPAGDAGSTILPFPNLLSGLWPTKTPTAPTVATTQSKAESGGGHEHRPNTPAPPLSPVAAAPATSAKKGTKRSADGVEKLDGQWPPHPQCDKLKDNCARHWIRENPGGSKAQFDAFYKGMAVHPKRVRWLSAAEKRLAAATATSGAGPSTG